MSALGVVCALVPGAARAAGLELLPGGTKAVARGGAVAARPSDPMAILQDPAGLSWLRGDQVMLSADLPLNHLCVKPYGYYGWGVYDGSYNEFGDPLAVRLDANGKPIVGATYATDPLDRVCNSAPALPIPSLGWTTHLGRRVAFGVGLVAPTQLTGLQWGGADGTINGAHGPRPTPTRYQLVRQSATFALDPAATLAYRAAPGVSIGVTLQVLMASLKSTVVQGMVSGSSPDTDMLARLAVHDYFVPSVTVSAHSRAFEGLDLMAALRVTDDFNGSGNVTFETNTYHRGDASAPVPLMNAPIPLDTVKVPFPWVLTTAARYAGRLPDAPSWNDAAGSDPMTSELWDIEVDLSWIMAQRASQTQLGFGGDVNLSSLGAPGAEVSTVTVKEEDLQRFSLDRHLQDALVARLGGSFSVIPRVLAVHGGVFYEGRGVDPDYANIDAMALRRIGTGLGVVVRVGAFDLMGAYGHIFMESLTVAPRQHLPVQASGGDVRAGFDQRVGGSGDKTSGYVLPDPDAPPPSAADGRASLQQTAATSTTVRPRTVVNAGEYSGSFDTVSVGASYHF